MVETNGSDDTTIPSTHPWRVQNLTFERPEVVITQYADVKSKEDSDLYIALTHLGFSTDSKFAEQYPYFDLIIGGHSHQKINTIVNEIPIFQKGRCKRLLPFFRPPGESVSLRNTRIFLDFFRTVFSEKNVLTLD